MGGWVMPTVGSTDGRGYGAYHKRVRAAWLPLVQSGIVACARCGYLIVPNSKWDLGHTEDRSAYTGPEHTLCNRRAGAIKGNRARGRVRASARGGRGVGVYPTEAIAPVYTSRDW